MKMLGASRAMSTNSIIKSHWVAFPFLVPAIVLLYAHRQLGLSDALNVPTPPGEREAYLFNWVLALVFYFGVGGFLLHALSLSSRGWQWLVAKLGFLAIYWGAILMLV